MPRKGKPAYINSPWLFKYKPSGEEMDAAGGGVEGVSVATATEMFNAMVKKNKTLLLKKPANLPIIPSR